VSIYGYNASTGRLTPLGQTAFFEEKPVSCHEHSSETCQICSSPRVTHKKRSQTIKGEDEEDEESPKKKKKKQNTAASEKEESEEKESEQEEGPETRSARMAKRQGALT